jgi:hypothetical protein
MDASAETVTIDIHGTTVRAPGDRVHVIFDEAGRPARLTLEPGGDWVVASVEPHEERRSAAAPVKHGARITLRREPAAT